MREIKFRAWDAMAEKMIYTDYSKYPGICEIILPYYGFFGTDKGGFITAKHKKGKVTHDTFVIGKSGVIMSYTGRKTDDKKEIYEGDIVYGVFTHNMKTITGPVFWSDNYSGFYVGYDDGEHKNITALSAIDRIKVLGNIYENPELYKKTDTCLCSCHLDSYKESGWLRWEQEGKPSKCIHCIKQNEKTD